MTLSLPKHGNTAQQKPHLASEASLLSSLSLLNTALCKLGLGLG